MVVVLLLTDMSVECREKLQPDVSWAYQVINDPGDSFHFQHSGQKEKGKWRIEEKLSGLSGESE